MLSVIRRVAVPLLLFGIAIFSVWQAWLSDQEHDRPPREPPTIPPPELRTPLLSVRRVPVFLQEPEADRRLVEDLTATAQTLPDLSCVAISELGRERYGHHADSLLVPASTQKLLTGVAAIGLLGPDYRFTTRLLTRSVPIDGVIEGDVWLVGSGDPLLASAEYSERYEDGLPFTDVGLLANQVAETGLTTITGAVIGDESLFDTVRFVPTWPERFRPGNQTQSGPLSALSINDGFTHWDSVRTSYGYNTPAVDPAQFAASYFDDLLEDRRIVIRRRPQAGVVPLDVTQEIASITSPPLSDIVRQMLLTSDNMTAELLLKALAAEQERPGSTNVGLSAMRDVLENLGVDLLGSVSADGSGLDNTNRISCAQLLGVLDASMQHLDGILHSGLPVAGESGTMRNRLVGSSAEGRVSAKTGTLRDVVSLAGRVETLEGRILTFAFLSNANPMPEGVRTLHDRLLLTLVSYPDGPDINLLEPLPVVTR